MSYSAPVSTLTPERRRAALRGHVPAVVALVLVGALVGLGLSLALPRAWSATASVLIVPLEGNPYNPTAQGTSTTNLETEAQIAGSEAISSQVVKSAGLDMTARQLAAHTSVGIESNTQILSITYKSPDSTDVGKIAQDVAQGYLDYRAQRRDASIQSRQDTITQRIATIDKQLTALTRKQPRPTLQLRALGGQLLNLRVQAADLASSTTSPGEVLVEATPHRSGLTVPPWLLVLAGALLGLVAGLTYALSRERRSDVVLSQDDVADLDVPVLGHQVLARSGAGDQVVDTDNTEVDVTAVLQGYAGGPSAVAFTADGLAASVHNPLPENVAAELVRAGASVLLVDADSTRPSAGAGLSDALSDPRLKLYDVVAGDGRGYATLAVGTRPAELADLGSTPRLTSLLEEAAAHYDWTIVRAPSDSTAAGRSVLRHCHHWVSAVTVGRTTRRDLARVIRWSRTNSVELLGFVLTTPTRRRVTRTRAARQPEPVDTDA